jgi:ubiquinone/menaquinone biosynthesis C-methylase UbiE
MSWTCLAQASFQVADALDQPFPDGQFDLVWSMESGEHMPNKKKVNILLLKRNLTV